MVDTTWQVVIAFVISIVIETAIGTIVGLVIKRQFDKRQEEKKQLEELKEQQRIREENDRCEVVKSAIHSEVCDLKGDFKKELEPLKDDLDKLKKGFQKDLRRSLRQDGSIYLKRGYASHQEKTEYDELYWSYHNMWKNGVVDAEHEKVMHLPDESKGE